MTFEACIHWLETVPLYGRKDGLQNMFRLMEGLGHPEKGLRAIHVAGTNGKGSCSAMLQKILMEAGYTVGLYTSPHLVNYRERIRVQDKWISEADFVRIADRVRRCNGRLVEKGCPHATFFEFLTAMAFVYFAEQKVDYAVLETGVGGRLDATNILEEPVCCLITSVSRDHEKVLGDTIPKIAAEKAGILKKNVPAVLAPNPPEVSDVIRARARELNCPFYEVKTQLVEPAAEAGGLTKHGAGTERDGKTDAGGKTEASVRTEEGGLTELLLREPEAGLPERFWFSLRGQYQLDNVSAVLRTVTVLQKKIRIPAEAVARALQTVRWAGRMEFVTVRGKTLLLEGAHNEDGAKRLGRYLADQDETVTFLFSALAKKNTEALLSGITAGPRIRKILFAPLENPGSFTADGFLKLYEKLGLTVPHRIFGTVAEALSFAVSEPDSGLIVCAGSLYLVGEAMQWLEGET